MHHRSRPTTGRATPAVRVRKSPALGRAVCDALEPRRMLTAVTTVGPFNGATSVPVAQSLTVTFDTAMTASTINATNLQLRNASNQVVAAAVTYNATTKTATIDPTANLSATTNYFYARVAGGTAGVKDSAGNAMAADFNWSFTTGKPAFTEQTVFSGLDAPSSVQFAADGRVFVAERSGVIKVFDNLADTTPTVFADLRTQVHNFWDRGLLGMALDPQFPTRPYVYVLYTRDADLGGTAPKWGTAGTASDGGGSDPTGTGVTVSGRLSRLTAAGNVMTGTEQVLIDDWVNQFPSHSIGHLAFGPDGYLYASAGDGASFNFVDYGQVGNPFSDPANEGGALRSQDVRSPNDPTSLDGSLIRIDPDTGAAAPGNPNTTGDDNAKRIVGYGLRNPFRFTFRPGTSEIWAGDVGWNTYEEIDRLVNPTAPAATNFGWPAYEGNNRQSGYDAANLPLLESLYTTPGADTKPYYTYAHTEKVVVGSTEPTGGSSVSGVAFYQGGNYPAAFDGALFFADYSRKQLYIMYKGPNGLPNVASRSVFKSLSSGAVELTVGPGGDLYYIDMNGGRVQRFVATGSANRAPVAAVTADKTSGPLPLAVKFSAAGSSDPDAGDTLTYAWDLDADGQFDDSTAVAPTYTYTTAGPRLVQVRVTDRAGLSSVAAVTINASNTAPAPTITSPTTALKWSVGQTISFTGSAADAQDGTLPASALTWSLVLIHGNLTDPANTHSHVIQNFAGVSSGSFIAPDHEYPSSLELRLTATDSGGLATTTVLRLDPKTVGLTFNSTPAGAQVTFDGDTFTTPFTQTVIANSAHSIAAATSQTIGGKSYAFQSWSDGGAADHNLTAAAGGTYTATYAPAAAAGVMIDAGGPAVGAYVADTGFTGGSTFSTAAFVDTGNVTNPAPTAVYQTERSGKTFGYTVAGLTPGAAYSVRLHFAEIWWTGAGARSFNVAINGQTALSNFDIYAAAGGANKAIARQFAVAADSSGKITINFTSNLDNASVSAVEVQAATKRSGITLAAGGPAVGSYGADDYYTGGSIFSAASAVSTAGVTNPAPAAVYQSERSGTAFGYTIDNFPPLAAYTVRLHFAEIWWTSAGQRAFDVAINGVKVLTNFDVFAAAGGAFKAIVKTFAATADANGKIAITFTAKVDQAKVSAIEIAAAASGAPGIPANPQAAGGSGQISLTWTAAANATSYNVYRSTTPGGQAGTPYAAGLTTAAFTDSAVAAGQTYYYVVSAQNAAGEGGRSAEAWAAARRTSLLIDSGGPGAGSFPADASFAGGGVFAVADAVNTASVANAAPAAVYQTERFGNFTYTAGGFAPGAAVAVRLHFAELWWTAAGQRRFNVSINGQPVLADFDVFTAAGGKLKALVKEFAATADNAGNVTIGFASLVDNATVAGVEILPPAGAASAAATKSAVASQTATGTASNKKAAREAKKQHRLAVRAAAKLARAMRRALRHQTGH